MDYCTLFPEGWWAHCCAAHDNAYAAQVGQSLADGQLLYCVAQSLPATVIDNPLLAGAASVASVAVGGIMWFGVRLFGRRYYRRAKKSPTR